MGASWGVRWRGVTAVLIAAGLLGGCGSGAEATISHKHRERVRQIFVVESSWFATNPKIVSDSLYKVGGRMAACAHGQGRQCQVMTYAVRGAAVSAERVPESLKENDKTGFWYALSTTVSSKFTRAHAAAVSNRIGAYVRAVAQEIVPETYESQPRGCVNLIANLQAAFDELKRHEGDRNIISIYASGISNCMGQPFYPDRPFPAAAQAASAVLAQVPPGSARLATHRVCVEWSPMFGVSYIEKGNAISNEQRQVLKQAWQEILRQWGAVSGNEPGEQPGSCLTMKVAR